MSLFYRKKHLKTNKEAEKLYFKTHESLAPFIDDQNSKEMKAMKFGQCHADFNACEVIASYNILKYYEIAESSLDSKNESEDGYKGINTTSSQNELTFADVLYDYEKKGLTLNGVFGVEPTAIYRYFKKKDRFVVALINGDDYEDTLIDKKRCPYIVTFFNDGKTVMDGIHTVCILPTDDSKFFVLNSSNAPAYKRYESASKAVSGILAGGGKMICIIEVASV